MGGPGRENDENNETMTAWFLGFTSRLHILLFIMNILHPEPVC